MAFELKDKDGNTVGGNFASVGEAKRAVPQVSEWRQDESRELGRNGWLPDPATGAPVPGSKPDYTITWVPVRMT
jgi:hypothetical protein